MIETQAVYENGVLRPLSPLPLREKQTVALTITESLGWLDDLLDAEFVEQCRQDPQDAPSLEEVRRLLSAGPGSLSEAVLANRDDERY
jgi:predicted DNA-binding antitoxin AbrB/MazE fold protein